MVRRALPSVDFDLLHLDYWRTVAVFAARINGGADPRRLCIESRFIAESRLARLVPGLSNTPALINTEAITAAPELRVHQLIARHCLLGDVLRCLARYHDEALANFWFVQLAAA
jgi:hypothetical protein